MPPSKIFFISTLLFDLLSNSNFLTDASVQGHKTPHNEACMRTEMNHSLYSEKVRVRYYLNISGIAKILQNTWSFPIIF